MAGKAKMIGSSIVLALIHYAAFSVSYVRVEVVHSVPNHELWQTLHVVLGFPFGYLGNGPLHVDVFPIAIAANSLLWGTACTAAVAGFMRLIRQRSGSVSAP